MDVLVCIKRVPMVGERIPLTADHQDIDAEFLGFTISPHEECAVEEAVRIAERQGGTVTVLTLGPDGAAEQLRYALSLGAHRALLLETDGREWGPIATADAIADAIRQRGPFDLVLFGNESADSAGYQVGVRVAHQLGLPVVTGAKAVEIGEAGAQVRREYRGAAEVFELPLPAVMTVKEGINVPRYPSLPGRLRARKAPIDRLHVGWRDEGLRKRRLEVPAAGQRSAEVLGTGEDAIPKLIGLLENLGILA